MKLHIIRALHKSAITLIVGTNNIGFAKIQSQVQTVIQQTNIAKMQSKYKLS